MKKAIRLGCALLAAVVMGMAVGAEDWTAQVAEDLAHEVRPGGVNGQPFWNANAIFFMYPPAFDFREFVSASKQKVTYRFEVRDANGKFHFFHSPSPKTSLAQVWPKLPTGFTTVTCRAEEGWPGRAITVGTRAFWKSAPFTGNYPAAKTTHAAAAKAAFEYVLKAPSNVYLVEKGELDPSFQKNAYPSKMLAANIQAACTMAERYPELRIQALKLAHAAADWLIAHGEKPDAPLAYFPPTYRGTEIAAGEYQGQTMIIYPAVAASAYLRLYAVTKEAKYLKSAEDVAGTFLKLQGEDGTWPLKLTVKDGKPIGPNRLIPIAAAIPLMEELAKVTGKPAYRDSADRAYANLERTRLKTWNWEGQFEDVLPNEPYLDLTKHDACATAIYLCERFPKDAEKIALARELLRFSEDQFVCWEVPYQGENFDADTAMRDLRCWVAPCSIEQYYWYTPIDASAAKMIRTYLALWRVEKKPLDLAKAKALGDAATRVQWVDGAFPTHWAINEYTDILWINCHISTAIALDELARAEASTAANSPSH